MCYGLSDCLEIRLTPFKDKLEYHNCRNVFIQDLMRELDEKEEVIKSVQDKAERLMLKNHPAKLTIEVSPSLIRVLGLWSVQHWHPVFQFAVMPPPCIQFKFLFQHVLCFPLQAYRAAMQTQWSWILQLCSCVEQHLKENAVYFEVSCFPFTIDASYCSCLSKLMSDIFL